ncbi:vacuolar protein sorting/targeting protein PEP1, partial [Cladochytrium tenue]
MYLREYGSLFKSNSNGTFYSRILENTNRNERGIVDFSKMTGIPGVILANEITNVNELFIGGVKKVRTKISFDGGSHWRYVSPPSKDSDGNKVDCSDENCSLNLYNRYSEFGLGRASPHSSRASAGVMLAVGNPGSSLASYTDCNTYLTKDAGRNWVEVNRDAQKWAIGDHGGLIILVNDEVPTDILQYSYDYGSTWNKFIFSDHPIRILSVGTEPASTSLTFLISGIRQSETDRSQKYVLVSVNFQTIFDRQCEKGRDLDEWSPSGDDGKDRCFLGQDASFYRKKDGVTCYIGREFDEDLGSIETCSCTDKDFECDFNYYLDPSTDKCVPYSATQDQPSNCKPGEKYKGSSGYRKIAISKCKGGVDLSEPVNKECSSGGGSPGSGGNGNVKISTNMFRHGLSEYFYFNQTRTLLIRDSAGRVWRSEDAGMSWAQPEELKDVDVHRIVLDSYRSDRRAFFISGKTELYYTDDLGKSLKKISLPAQPNRLQVDPLVTHVTEEGYLIFVGDRDCDSSTLSSCRTQAFVSTNTGRSWNPILYYTQKCAFGLGASFTSPPKDQVYCLVFDVESGDQRSMNVRTNRQNFVSSENLGGDFNVAIEDAVGFALSYEFMVVAKLPAGATELRLLVSTDGRDWNTATFEDDDKIPDYGYTLLDSSSGSVFLQVFSNRAPGSEYGALYRSIDYDGTVFKLSLGHVNQDAKGFTDFERLQTIPGVSIANQVVNSDKVDFGSPKQVRTMITFNDGEVWASLKPPKADVYGAPYSCNDECSLNIHHFTERTDTNDLFSSASAPGFLIGVGNVGPHLTAYNDGDMFMSKDGGRTWLEIAKEAHAYEFGNRGGAILLANNEVATDGVRYSLDHGQTFVDLRLSDQLGGARIRVTHIITEPYGSAASFV